MKTAKQLLAIVVGGWIIPLAAQAQVILVNGSFETGDLSGWETSGSVSPAQTVYGTTDGAYAIGLNCGNANPANGVLSQSFTTVPGGQYLLAFDLGAFGAALPIGLSAQVLCPNNEAVLDASATVTTYRYYTTWAHSEFSFTATSPISTLVLQDTSPTSAEVDGVLDNVSITLVAVPEPGTCALATALGLLGLACWRKSRG